MTPESNPNSGRPQAILLEDIMNICYSLTRNLYPYLLGSIRSLLDHNPDVMIYVMAEDDELPFEIPCPHRILNMSGQTYFPASNPNMKSQFSYMAMLRLATANLIPEDKVIQLDIDTIVCDSLAPIWEMDLTGKWLAWCPEHNGSFKPFGPKYYNFGVAVLNLAQLRADNAPAFMIRTLNVVQVPFLDQDIMNIFAVPDKCVDLPVRFNESFCCGYTANPAIVHFAGFPDWMTNRAIYRSEYLAKYADD